MSVKMTRTLSVSFLINHFSINAFFLVTLVKSYLAVTYSYAYAYVLIVLGIIDLPDRTKGN